MHESSMIKMQTFKDTYLSGRQDHPLTILDLGSMDVNGSYKPIFTHDTWTYVGVDREPGNNVDVVLHDPYRWQEIKSASIDVVISGQAFEHIEYFWITMLEIARVLRPQGICCILAPSSGPEHRYPVDCWRFYPDGFAALSRFAGLDVLMAHTQWEDLGYADGSDQWHDSMLVCRKSQQARWRTYKAGFKRYLRHQALRLGL